MILGLLKHFGGGNNNSLAAKVRELEIILRLHELSTGLDGELKCTVLNIHQDGQEPDRVPAHRFRLHPLSNSSFSFQNLKLLQHLEYGECNMEENPQQCLCAVSDWPLGESENSRRGPWLGRSLGPTEEPGPPGYSRLRAHGPRGPGAWVSGSQVPKYYWASQIKSFISTFQKYSKILGRFYKPWVQGPGTPRFLCEQTTCNLQFYL